jgi:hypothetical protein
MVRVVCAILVVVHYHQVRIASRSEGRHMQHIQCPTCGRETAPGAACPGCGHTADNGAAGGLAPVPPPEVARWIIERPSPDVLAWARQTFNEAGFLAALREIEQGGGHHFEDFIGEIERIAHGTE